MTTTLFEELSAYRQKSNANLTTYGEACKKMGLRFVEALREVLGAPAVTTGDLGKASVGLWHQVHEPNDGVVSVRTTIFLGNHDAMTYDWTIGTEHGEWRVKSFLWTQTKDLKDGAFKTTVEAAVKDMCGDIRKTLDTKYQEARWSKLLGKADSR